MKQTIWKLENCIKDYDWGSIDSITTLFGIKNPSQKPMAEIWMGIHPLGCSKIIGLNGEKINLNALINQNPLQILGKNTYQLFGTLPYLFKVLAANKPLSVQVHPTKADAQKGFEKENKLGIDLHSPNRNFKDPNHKPELLYALTPFKAMNSFRPIEQILSFFSQITIPIFNHELAQLQHNPHPKQLKHFFQFLLNLSPDKKLQAIHQLLACTRSFNQEPFLTIHTLVKDYPNDIGLFMPLILNVIELKPSQAMFLHAQTPHCYLSGTGFEVMANSDNVLRAGLTHKFIDIDALIANTNFSSIDASELLINPLINHNKIDFPVPVNDFKFEIIQSDLQLRKEKVNSPQILFCANGAITLTTKHEVLTLNKGESVFIAYHAKYYSYSGKGCFAKVSD
ncbi:mannose-6-phosphate isomerase, class I [Gilliamella sp. CG35]|uniref:mannose-6-phosphate isomerase, class I n=1 Tax=Gilliamella sp. CG35 TaxID=3351507 RepID=UPI0039883154